MFRPVIVSTAVLCGLFLGADGAAAGSPNLPNTPKITVPRPPAASRILILPRTITVPRADESADDGDSGDKKKKKKKVAKKPAGTGTEPSLALERQTPPPPSSPNAPHVPEDLRIALDPDAASLADLRKRIEGAEGLNDDGSFDPLGTLFPSGGRVDQREDFPGANSHTTGGRDDSHQPGDSIDEIMAAFANQGSGDGRKGDGEHSGSAGRGGPLHGEERGDDVGRFSVGAFSSGLPDPSGQVSQGRRGRWSSWEDCGAGCRERSRRITERNGNVGSETERRDDTGRTRTTRSGGTETVRHDSSDQNPRFFSYTSSSVTSMNQTKVETRRYDSGRVEVISYVINEDGEWEERNRVVARRGDDQPAEEGYGSGPNNERGHVGFYNVNCSGGRCTYTPLSMEEIMVDTGLQINPGGIDRPGPGDISYGPRVGPGAATDPHPDDVYYGRSGGQRPVEPGCGGMIRC